MNFLEQLQRLREKTPLPALFNMLAENSPYANYSDGIRNCYLVFGVGKCENVYYGTYILNSRDCCDAHFLRASELCYECLDCLNCYNCDFCQDCRDCTDDALLFDCVGCTDCFGCVGLRRKSFYIFNQPYSREEYKRKLQELWDAFKDPKKRSDILAQFETMKKKTPRVHSRQINCENSIGDYMENTKNCYACYDARDAEDCLYCERPMVALKNDMDCANCYKATELCYEVMSGVTLTNSNFCNVCWYSNDLEYCEYVFNSHDCFGCISLNHAEYRILNQQYTKDEYFKRVAEIKAEMQKQGVYGKHLLSTFPLEDTISLDYFPHG